MFNRTKDNGNKQLAVDLVKNAIDHMIEKDPFFGYIIDQMRLEPDGRKDVKTIATNGKILVFDSNWIVQTFGPEGDYSPKKGNKKDLAIEMLSGVMAHEAAHVAFGHPYRLGQKDPKIFDQATDAVVNDILLHSKAKHIMPSDGFFIPGARHRTAEQIYRMLKSGSTIGQDGEGLRKGSQSPWGKCFSPSEGTDEEEKRKAEGGGQEGDGDSDGDSDGIGEKSDSENEFDVMQNVARAAAMARKAGNMPGSYEKMIEAATASSKDWRDELRRFLGGGQDREQSWSKPNRRFVHQDLYLPGTAKFGPGEVVLAIDVSGSVQGKLVEKFVAEVRKINEDLQPDKTHVMTCCARVGWQETFGPYDDVVVPSRALTGGGTAFSPVFKNVANMGVEPKALVYFTDLECADFGPKPDYPVLWVVWPGGSDKAPWGTIVQMDD